ncbi:MAG: NADP-dependent glyceraldehyde-3-phosphate dehydrogenase [Phycisphaerae bacterium]|nr:NADP-dependent glyceraldehyde-3-phosphate dehydrogenase [Phycisphaerae bacterium]
MPTTVDAPKRVFPEVAEIPADVRMDFYGAADRYLVGGEVRSWSGPRQRVLSPVCVAGSSGSRPFELGEYPLMTAEAALEVLDAACRAYGQGCGRWPTMSVADRIHHLESFIPRMQVVREQVVCLLMWEIGKSRADSCKEFDRTVDYIRDTIEALKELDRNSSRFAVEQGFVAQIRRSPLGVVLCMGPQNYPLNETFTTLIPALIMGNTVIFKPPKYGVLLHAPLLEAFACSFPPGVVNTVYGDGPTVVGPLIEGGRIDVLAFIGSAKVASLLKHQHPRPNRLRCVLGLDAKNAAVVLPDADLDLAVSECVLGALSFNGQRCTAIKIIFVHRSLADEFAQRFARKVEQLKVGMPWDDGVHITPLAEQGRPEWFKGLVDEAVAAGAKVVNRGGGTIDQTLFYPAVLYPADLKTRICQIEQFGPVTPIVPYDDEREVIDWVVACPFGQQAALFGSDPRRLSRLIDPLVNQVSRVNINSQCQRGPDKFPFVGRKDSAEGTLSVSDALRVFSIRSLVAAKSTEPNQRIVSGIVSGRCSKFLSTDFIF